MKKKVVLKKKLKGRDTKKPVDTFSLPYSYDIPTAGANSAITIMTDDLCTCDVGWYCYVPFLWIFYRRIFICSLCGAVKTGKGNLQRYLK